MILDIPDTELLVFMWIELQSASPSSSFLCSFAPPGFFCTSLSMRKAEIHNHTPVAAYECCSSIYHTHHSAAFLQVRLRQHSKCGMRMCRPYPSTFSGTFFHKTGRYWKQKSFHSICIFADLLSKASPVSCTCTYNCSSKIFSPRDHLEETL